MRVLLIRLRLIGDVVLSTPLIRALRRTFPDATLSYLVERDAAAVVSGNPHLDEVIVVERTRGVARIVDDVRLARRLRQARFDVVIDMHGGPRSSWLALATGAPQRIGYDIAGRHWMYTRTVPRARELRPRHSVVNQWDLLPAESRARVIDFGEFDIGELRALVGRSRLFIGGDTGPLHVAATTATPIVAIYGPTLPARSAPWRRRDIPSESVEITGLACRPCDQRVCAPGDYRCLTTLRPAAVLAAAERALACIA